MAKVAFVGLGVMGFPMAGHLAKAGHELTVYNRTAKKAAEWASKHRGKTAATPAEAARGADIVCTCVGNDDDLRSVIYGDSGVFAGMSKGAILADHTTASAIVAREIDAEAKKRGFGFLDAPLSGGQAGAENAQLTIMVGGDDATYAKSEPVLKVYAKAITHMGAAGNGQLTKMVNQICIAGLVQALSEGVNFAKRAGLDTDKVLATISKGAAQSWQMENRWKTMAEGKFDFGFAVEWMRKDLGMCLAESKNNGARLPVTALVDQFYATVMARGGKRWDTSSLVQPLQKD
jgi:3-hydroxyisobutyrate dehydrogenase